MLRDNEVWNKGMWVNILKQALCVKMFMVIRTPTMVYLPRITHHQVKWWPYGCINGVVMMAGSETDSQISTSLLHHQLFILRKIENS